MKKLLKNKYVQIAGLLLLGGLAGWLIGSSHEQPANTSENQEHQHAEVSEVWTCSMHPQIRQSEPGSCPICGMDLIPVSETNGEGIDPKAVSMSPTAMQLANVVTAKVGSEAPVKSIRLNGKIQEDERLVYSQSTHIPGRIEKLYVNFTGEYIKKGTWLASIYSPELVTAQQELFEAWKFRETQPSLYRAAREKLKNWKLTENQIDGIIDEGKVKENFPITADISGYVIEKKVSLGDYIKLGETIYEIADLSRVWVQFDVYESDMPWINKGDKVSFTISSLPGKNFDGTIDYIDPVINPKTRIAKARLTVPNSDGLLKPEMFVSGTIEARLKQANDQLVIPKSAVMWTGKRSVVYVKVITDQGLYFRMREVTLGPGLGDSYVIESGLEAGEEIAVNGTFSIDAAAQLAGKPSMMTKEGGTTMSGHNHGKAHTSAAQPEPDLKVNDTKEVLEVDDAFKMQLVNVFKSYLPIKDALVASDPEKASENAKALLSAIQMVDMKLLKGEAHMEWMEDLNVLKASAKEMSDKRKLESIRKLLLPLSNQLYHSLKKFQVDVNGYRQYCPMAINNTGAYWLSDSEEILNPYFGEAMLTCGNVDDEL